MQSESGNADHRHRAQRPDAVATNPHAVIDSRRNIDRQRFNLLDFANAMTLRTRRGDIASAAMTLRTGLLNAEKALRHPHHAAAAATRTGLRLRSGRCA